MKLTCELCGGSLQVTSGGQSAACTNCGLNYPMSRLREMLGLAEPVKEMPVVQDSVKEEPIKQEPVQKPAVKTVKVVKKATVTASGESVINEIKEDPAPVKSTFVPQQFMMQHQSGIGDLSGYIRSGAVGLGDNIYVNGDYSHPYTVYCINDDSNVICAKAGSYADLFLTSCPRKVLKAAQTVTGDPNPVANAYNYPGTVEEYFAYLLQQEFSQYKMLQNVPITGVRKPASFVLYRSGKPVAAIFLVHSNDNKSRYDAAKAREVCASQGYCSTHFFINYRNDAPYVVSRIKGVMGF